MGALQETWTQIWTLNNQYCNCPYVNKDSYSIGWLLLLYFYIYNYILIYLQLSPVKWFHLDLAQWLMHTLERKQNKKSKWK